MIRLKQVLRYRNHTSVLSRISQVCEICDKTLVWFLCLPLTSPSKWNLIATVRYLSTLSTLVLFSPSYYLVEDAIVWVHICLQ